MQRLGIEAVLPVTEGSAEAASLRRTRARARSREPGRSQDQISASDFDQAAIGRLLADLGDQVQRLANSDIQIEIADQLSQLSVLLSSEDDFLSGE